MHITLKGDFDTGMTKDCAERLHVEAETDAAGGKAVTQGMKSKVRNSALIQNVLIVA